MLNKLGEWIFSTVALKFVQVVLYCVIMSAIWRFGFSMAWQAAQESRLVSGLQLAAVRRPRLGRVRLLGRVL